jgi:hypothetical protein
MMNNNQPKDALDGSKESAKEKKGETVRGSGFTYDESRDHTDESIPIEKAQNDEIVELPDLGKPNRP